MRPDIPLRMSGRFLLLDSIFFVDRRNPEAYAVVVGAPFDPFFWRMTNTAMQYAMPIKKKIQDSSSTTRMILMLQPSQI